MGVDDEGGVCGRKAREVQGDPHRGWVTPGPTCLDCARGGDVGGNGTAGKVVRQVVCLAGGVAGGVRAHVGLLNGAGQTPQTPQTPQSASKLS